MIDDIRILGLFFSDEDNLVYDKIKFSTKLSEEKKNQLNMLSYKYLGPIFLTAASSNEDKWRIKLIESSLSHYQGQISDIMQSFFSLNSTIASQDGVTNLFTLIGSPYTEDIYNIYNILTNYVHPSINQGKIVNENLLGNRFLFHKFIKEELTRGLNLINYSLGSMRKAHWEEPHNYSCVGLIERTIEKKKEIFYLYSFDENDALRRETLKFIPSYYIMCILPDYYENLIEETLSIFKITSLFPNIRLIKLKKHNRKVIYLEEFQVEKNIKKSYGVILVQDDEILGSPNKISYYKKNLRLILEGNKHLEDNLNLFNPKFTNKKWLSHSEEDLDKISEILDY